MNIGSRVQGCAAVGAVLLSIHCSAAPDAEKTGSASGAMSSHIPSNGKYGVTVFGGDGDRQPTACGGNTGGMQSGSARWYVASSQRYGCHRHLKLVRGSKCLVVQTVDAGPSDDVEERAGMAVMDASPAVARYFFDQDDLGAPDIAGSPGSYTVTVTTTSASVGPCSGGSSDDNDDNSSGGWNNENNSSSGGWNNDNNSSSSGGGGGNDCNQQWNACYDDCGRNDNDCYADCDSNAKNCEG